MSNIWGLNAQRMMLHSAGSISNMMMEARKRAAQAHRLAITYPRSSLS